MWNFILECYYASEMKTVRVQGQLTFENFKRNFIGQLLFHSILLI